MRRSRADLIQDIDRIRHAFRSFKRAAQTLLRAPDHWGRHPAFLRQARVSQPRKQALEDIAAERQVFAHPSQREMRSTAEQN